MFTLSAMPVKFVCLLLLFAFTTVWEAGRLVAARSATGRISHGLHLLMSVLMLAMVPRQVWMPVHMALGLPAMIGLMALGVLWFGWLAVRAGARHGEGAHRAHARRHALGCAAMFAAMVWHLWAMQVSMSHTMAMTMPQQHQMDHSMEHAPMQPMPMGTWAEQAARPGGVMWWFAVVGLVVMAWLLVAALRDLSRAVRTPGDRLESLAGFAMNFGMFWMSTGLLTPVLPFFRLLSF